MSKHDSQGSEPDRKHGQQSRSPYWRRAHKGWPFWVAVVLMLLAITIYLSSNDLAWRRHGLPMQSMSRHAGN